MYQIKSHILKSHQIFSNYIFVPVYVFAIVTSVLRNLERNSAWQLSQRMKPRGISRVSTISRRVNEADLTGMTSSRRGQEKKIAWACPWKKKNKEYFIICAEKAIQKNVLVWIYCFSNILYFSLDFFAFSLNGFKLQKLNYHFNYFNWF